MRSWLCCEINWKYLIIIILKFDEHEQKNLPKTMNTEIEIHHAYTF